MRPRKIIKYSAPYSIVLSGEFGDIYGKPVLSAALSQRLYFSVWEGINKQITNKQITQIANEVKKYLTAKNLKIREKKFNFRIEKDNFFEGSDNISPLTVASTAALLEFFSGIKFDKEEVSRLAYKIEKIFDKNSLGCNIATSCFGGLIYFRKEFEFLKNISQLQFNIPKNIEDCLYLIKLPEGVKFPISQAKIIGNLYNKNSKKAEGILNELEKATKRLIVTIIKGDKDFLAKTLRNNERLLEKLGTVSKSLSKLIEKVDKFGAAAIISNRYIICLTGDYKMLNKFMSDNNLSIIKFKLSVSGLIKE